MKIEVINKTDPNRCNCVYYVKKRIPDLPAGLWTIFDKSRIINSKIPAIGAVAIMNVGIWYRLFNKNLVFSGHMGIVKNIKDNEITIEEANFIPCTITRRTGTEKDLKIIGYFIPKQRKPVIEPNLGEKRNLKTITNRRKYYLMRGDTLWRIAEKFLGDGRRWKEIIVSRYGRPVSEKEARTLRIGEEIIIPDK